MLYVYIALAVLILGGLVAMLIYTVPIAKWVYKDQLVRSEEGKWGRVCSAPDNPEQMAMWEAGNRWGRDHRDAMEEVAIENEGLRLCGEFYNFGSKRCVIILPGRCECLRYSYYFAPPYEKAGYNVLVTDARSHGLSEGDRSTIGLAESRDLIAWINFLIREKGMEAIYLHGICIGSTACYLAMLRKDCPKEVLGFTAEGSYKSFRDSFRRHMIALKRPTFPVLDLVMLEIWFHTGHNPYHLRPIRLVKKLHQRALFIFGEEDIFSVPPNSRKIFAACGSADKRIVWLPRGSHSHLRINNTAAYDAAITEFLADE